MRPKLTIGMAVYDDFNGAYFTLQSLRLHHDLREVELVVIDNKPDSPDSGTLRNLVNMFMKHGTAGARYIAAPEVVGTSAPRNRVFTEATGEAVLCMDSHVMLPAGAIARLLKWYADHPDSQDLLTGPIMMDDLGTISTHFVDVWRSQMWGIWGSAWEACPGGDRFAVLDNGGRAQFITLEMGHVPLSSSAACGIEFPSIPYTGHERELHKLGFKPLGFDVDDEFDIPGQGLGLFTCRKDAWLGFNADFRGFGGEELYIHEKFRQAGRRCICLGFLKWLHRFARPGGIKYPLTAWNKARNYVLGHNELGLPLDRARDNFVVDQKVFTASEWEKLVADPSQLSPPAAKAPESIEEIYERLQTMPRDLEKHFPRLRELAEKCPRITEFSKRRESLAALAAGCKGAMVSYNTEANDPFAKRLASLAPFLVLENKSSPDVPAIAETDLLFIDSRHTFDRLTEELTKFSGSVTRYIVMHDTALHGSRGEDGGKGLLDALREFVKVNQDWFVVSHTKDQYGLTVLGRRAEDLPAKRIIIWNPGFGPGTELTAILATLGITPSEHCDCKGKANQMDLWGVEGCRKQRDTIVQWMRDGQERWGWKDRIAAATKAVTSGLAFQLNPLDPFPSLIDECIRRAEEKEASQPACQCGNGQCSGSCKCSKGGKCSSAA